MATGACFTEVVESCDAAAVSAIAAEGRVRAWATDDPIAVAATLLVGIARRRPFRHGNAAAAWLAAAHVVSTGSMRLTMPDELVVALVSRAGGGAADQPAVAAALAAHVTPTGRRRRRARTLARRAARWLTAPARRTDDPAPLPAGPTPPDRRHTLARRAARWLTAPARRTDTARRPPPQAVQWLTTPARRTSDPAPLPAGPTPPDRRRTLARRAARWLTAPARRTDELAALPTGPTPPDGRRHTLARRAARWLVTPTGGTGRWPAVRPGDRAGAPPGTPAGRAARWPTEPARRTVARSARQPGDRAGGTPGDRQRARAPAGRPDARPPVASCPACGRPVRPIDVPGAGPWLGRSRYELTALCWYEHRAHGRDGRVAAAPQPPEPPEPPSTGADRWAPVTENDGGAFLAAAPDGALLFLPARDGSGWTVALVTDPCAGDLVGDWSRLAATGEVLGRADPHAVRLEKGLLDLWHLARHGHDLALDRATGPQQGRAAGRLGA